MRIDSCSFGNIVIDGQGYDKDVIIMPGSVLSPWWRKKGHSLSPEDLMDIMKQPPAILIIGTGSFGVMKVPRSTLSYLENNSIEPRVMRTGKAVDEFNRLVGQGAEVMAALHLTC